MKSNLLCNKNYYKAQRFRENHLNGVKLYIIFITLVGKMVKKQHKNGEIFVEIGFQKLKSKVNVFPFQINHLSLLSHLDIKIIKIYLS